jgi:hypothetical protein
MGFLQTYLLEMVVDILLDVFMICSCSPFSFILNFRKRRSAHDVNGGWEDGD